MKGNERRIMPLPNVPSIQGSKLQPLPLKRELETSRSRLTANEVHDGHVQEFKEKLNAELAVGGTRTLHSIKHPVRHARCHDDINGTLGLTVPFEKGQGGITIGAPQSPASGTSPPSNCKPGLPSGWGQGRCSINLPMTLLTTPSHSAGVAPPLMIPELPRTYSELTPASTPISRSLNNKVFSKASSMSFKSNGEGPDKIVTIDCGGIIFRTFARTLQKIPKSRLCKLADEGSPLMLSGYIFFDRNPVVFAAIMEYYRWIAAVVVRVCLSMSLSLSVRFLRQFCLISNILSPVSVCCLCWYSRTCMCICERCFHAWKPTFWGTILQD